MSHEREQMSYDVVIVGAGPAGLSAAIRLKQINHDLSVVIVEKASEIGGHILPGAVLDPCALDALLPAWRSTGAPAGVPVAHDQFLYLTKSSSIPLPHLLVPPMMSNRGNAIISLGRLCRWLAEQATTLGVEIYTGFSGAELIEDPAGIVVGITTGEMGLKKDDQPGASYAQGVDLIGKFVLLAEGVRGSLSKTAIAKYALSAGVEPQKYGIGLKEIWEVDGASHKPGLVQHAFGWPLDNATGGGAFIYHLEDRQVAIGLVVHLNYRNPYISPFEELQRLKTHPAISPIFNGGRRIAYGSRAISEGGYQSVPRLAFPGGVLVGDTAGFVNVPRIKGIHNAMSSGMLAADHVAKAIGAGRKHDILQALDSAWRLSNIGRDLKPVRNVKPLWNRFGTLGGMMLGGADLWCAQLLGRSPFGTLAHRSADHEALEPAARHRPIAYPKPDNLLTFDRASSVYLSNTNHRNDQPIHLKVADMALQCSSEYGVFGGPSVNYCPAGVYEWTVPDDNTAPRLVINSQNCTHCKTCDIKDPNQNITWTPPEGGGGPNYTSM